ncbi:MAG: hypothetical protein GTN73_05355 [Candidatus Aminicenantes bacterium]|nr:hypothetical protein [Candidatus Aminicenantes bacterium]
MSFVSFLDKNFNEGKLTEKRLKILTFLLLNAPGYFGEITVDKYLELFKESNDIFLAYLSNRADWQQVVDSLGTGDWGSFVASVKKLGDSGFEGEFKRYVLAPREKEGKRIIK